MVTVDPECVCGHPDHWHHGHRVGGDYIIDLGAACEFHCGNPERCTCPGYQPKERT